VSSRELALERYVELSRDAVVFTGGAEHLIEHVNAAFCALARLPREGLAGRRLGEVLAWIDGAMLDRVLASGVAESQIGREVVGPAGERLTLGCEVARLGGGLVTTVRDTTAEVGVRSELARFTEELRGINERLVVSSVREQEHAEAAELQRAQLQALIGSLSEGVLIADAAGRVVVANVRARELLATASLAHVDDLDAHPVWDLDGAVVPVAERPVRLALRGEVFDGRELLHAMGDGSQRRVVTAGTHVDDDQGAVALAIVVLRDVTALRELERQREEYAALVSHDLRVPLTAMLLFASTLQRSLRTQGLDADADTAERVERNGARMNAMIDEILEATSLERGDVALHRLPLDLGEIVTNVVAHLDDAARDRVRVEKTEASCSVLGDAGRLARAITNLVANALKYSPADVPVRAVLRRNAGEVALDVVDRGVGIARGDAAVLFDRFRRGSRGQGAGGLGLGLYIVRLVAEAHGGRVEVEPVEGGGSVFRLVLPAR
jgi:NtrC-family two-component system sensor histidine kinase KinB